MTTIRSADGVVKPQNDGVVLQAGTPPASEAPVRPLPAVVLYTQALPSLRDAFVAHARGLPRDGRLVAPPDFLYAQSTVERSVTDFDRSEGDAATWLARIAHAACDDEEGAVTKACRSLDCAWRHGPERACTALCPPGHPEGISCYGQQRIYTPNDAAAAAVADDLFGRARADRSIDEVCAAHVGEDDPFAMRTCVEALARTGAQQT